MQSVSIQKLQRFRQALDTIFIMLVLCLVSSAGSCVSLKSGPPSMTDVAMPSKRRSDNHESTSSMTIVKARLPCLFLSKHAAWLGLVSMQCCCPPVQRGG